MQLDGQSPWRFRWVFDYSDGKPSVRGVWNYHSNTDKAASAFLQSKNNLLYAAIEAQDIHKNKIIRVAECSGDDYCNFQWIATVTTPGFAKGVSYTPVSTIVGMKLISRDLEVHVYSTGEVQVHQRQYSDNLFHYGRLDNA